MIKPRPAQERGHFNFGWLDTYHTFSFGDYHDPEHMGFRSLRVINEDRVAPGMGFGTHPHRDMEILTVVLEGALAHKDSMGNGSTIRPGQVQRMSAGTGVTHSEYNASKTEPVHLLQIWVQPERRGVTPSYEERTFPEAERRGQWRLVAAQDGREGAARWGQDADLYVTRLAPGDRVAHRLKPGRHAWAQVARGAITLNGQALQDGDGAAISDEEALEVRANEEAEVLLFDLA